MKLRFGWGPADGAAGMQQNVALVKTAARDRRRRTSTSWPMRTWGGTWTTRSG